MKKGRHRRYEEARELKRSREGDFESLLEDFADDGDDDVKPEHLAWADEFEAETDTSTNDTPSAADDD